MIRYALIAALAWAVAASGALWVTIDRNGDLRAAQEVTDARLRSCNARTALILKDKERDDEIEALDDDALRDLFLERDWMFDNPGAR